MPPHSIPAMKEAVLYILAGMASLFILGYSIHIFLGGIVSPGAERIAIAVAVIIGAAAMSIMTWDVLRRRRMNNLRRDKDPAP